MFPANNPNITTLVPVNALVNLADLPVLRAPQAGGLVNARVFVGQAITGNNTNYVSINLHKLGNTTHSYAASNIIAGTNISVNTWHDLTASSTYNTWAAGETVSLTVAIKNHAAVNYGTSGRFQVDWLPASYPRGG